MVRTLEFSLQHVSPNRFLDRFLRLFELDQDKDDKTAKQLGGLARQYIRFMQRESLFLKYKPSAIAAAALIFAINISQSKVAKEVLGIKRMENGKLEVSLNSAALLHSEDVSYENEKEPDPASPLRFWSSSIS